jgi:hypothetical protein
MRKLARTLGAVCIAAGGVLLISSRAVAVDTVADWTGENTNAANRTFTTVTTANNYGIISDTSVGGAVQSKLDFGPENFGSNNEQHVYLSDPTLETPLDFTSELHMSGTITFSSPTATEPNFFFGWYSSSDTGHRIGLGVSNSVEPGFSAEANYLRMDLGYGASGGNKFYFASGDGTLNQANHNSVLDSNTYPFTFDYVPQAGGGIGGSMSATVGAYHFSISPMDTQPWDLDFFSLDRFGIVQRRTTSTSNNGSATWNVVFANMTYTGGTPIAGAPVPPDFNASGTVGGADLAAWAAHYGASTGVTAAMGDADGDGDVDGHDFAYWQTHVNGAAVSGVPEPSALVLLGFSGVILARRLRKRCAC